MFCVVYTCVCVFVLLLDRERSRVFASTSRDLVLVTILSHVYDQLQLKFLLTVIVWPTFMNHFRHFIDVTPV